MAQILSAVPVGTVVKLKEGGSLVNFIVVHQGLPSEIYDASCNGTWVLRQDILENIQWADHKEDNFTDYSGSYLPSRVDSIVSTLDAGVQKLIRSVKVPLYNGYYLSTGGNGLSCRGIILSRTEYGILENGGTVDGAKLDCFNSYTADSDNHCRIANLNGEPAPYWTRTVTSGKTSIRTITEDGKLGGSFYFESYGLRYAMVLEPQYSVSDDGTVLAITQPTSISVQSVIVQGRSIALSWSPVDGAEGYLVQRKSDNGEWVQVYRGAELSCSDIAGTWSSVQYRVQALYEGLGGAWKESATVTVHSDSILTISGQDGGLGTLTNDVTYSAYSNTGHTISLSLSVNELLWKTENVSSGQVRTIPVVDLPTGSGTIVITAQVQTDLGPTSASRTWSYQKTAAVVPTAGQVVQLTQKGKNKWPVTLAEAVRTPDYMGGNLSKTLEMLDSVLEDVRPNLLDNPCFVGGGTGWGVFPVNQRGALSGNTDRTFLCDRWEQFGADWSLTADGLVMAKRSDSDYWSFFQHIPTAMLEALAGETLTASVLFDDSLVTAAKVLTSPVTYFPFDTGERVEVIPESGVVQYYGGSVTRTVKAIKLEVGNTQTLAYQDAGGVWHLLPQPEGDYAAQLLRCQQYQFVNKNPQTSFPAIMNGNYGTATVQTPVPMGKTPVFLKDAASGYGVVWTGTGAFAVTDVSVYGCVGNFVFLNINTNSPIVSNCVWRECTFTLDTGM